MTDTDVIRTFETGATRNNDTDNLDYEAFLSPLALKAYAEYMHKHRFQADGTLRDGDNWQKGIPLDSFMKSMHRHFMDTWLHHRNYSEAAREPLKEALCAILFNTFGYLHEIEKQDYLDQVEKVEGFDPPGSSWVHLPTGEMVLYG